MSDTAPAKTAPQSHDVLWIFDPDGRSAPFAYTVGLAARPALSYELALSGFSAELACAVLNNTAARLITGGIEPDEGLALDDVIEGYEVRLRLVDDVSDFHGMREVLGEQPAVWQVLWPDARGRFPGDPGHRDEPTQHLL